MMPFPRRTAGLLSVVLVVLPTTASLAQTSVTLNATSGTGTSSTNYSTTGGLTLNLGFFAEYLAIGGGGSGGTPGGSGGQDTWGTGGGGGGGQGGSGIVIVRYQGASLGAIGGTVTSGSRSAAGYTLHTFTTTGTTTATSALNLSGVSMNARLATTLTGTISGSGGLTYTGPGTLTLTAANTYSGPTVVSGGTLAIGAGASITHSGTTLIVGGNLSGGATANGLSGALVIDGGNVSARDVYIAHSTTRPWTSTGVLNVSSGTLSAAGDLGVGTRPAGVGSYFWAGSGTLNVLSGGVVDVRGQLISGSGSNFSVAAGGTLKVGGEVLKHDTPNAAVNDGTVVFDGVSYQRYGTSYGGSITGTGAVVKSGGLLAVDGPLLSTGGWTISSGRVRTAVGNIYNSSTVANDGVLELGLVTSSTFAGAISGTGGLLSTGWRYGASLTLTGSNTFTGLTQMLMNSGTLSVGNGGTSGSLAGGQQFACFQPLRREHVWRQYHGQRQPHEARGWGPHAHGLEHVHRPDDRVERHARARQRQRAGLVGGGSLGQRGDAAGHNADPDRLHRQLGHGARQ